MEESVSVSALFRDLPELDGAEFTAEHTLALWGGEAAATDPGMTIKGGAAADAFAGGIADTVAGDFADTFAEGIEDTLPGATLPGDMFAGITVAGTAPDSGRGDAAAGAAKAALPKLQLAESSGGGAGGDSTVILTIGADGFASMTMPGASVTLAPRRTTVSSGGEYEIGDVLGKGGMGVVNAARQASLDRRIVVKSIRPEYAGRVDAQQKFITEALATASLDHPGVVPVHDMGVGADGNLFYVMKEVKGDTWRKRMRSLSEPENIDILLRVCDAVACAHDKGIIHRDLKPDNVMLGDYGEVLLMDWGLAAAVTPAAKAAHLTNAAACAGTPSFMAPEMARGVASGIGVWSDQYLLGAILFTLLAGRPPHPGMTAREALTNAANNVLAPAARDDEWMAVALRAMKTQPYSRYPSVKDFQKALRSCQVHHESIVLVNRGDESFAAAVGGGGHDDFNRALSAYEQALVLWPENAAAVGKRRDARYAYAERAFADGDHGLVLSLLEQNPDSREESLVAAANEEIRQREVRRRRVKVFAFVVVAALALVAAVALGAYVLIARQAEAERLARAEAEAQRQTAVAERARADEERAVAEDARLVAEGALTAAERARAAEALAKDMQLRDQAAKLVAEESARQRAEEALAAREEIQRMGYLEDNTRWRFSPEAAAERRAAAAREHGLPPAESFDAGDAVFDFVLVPPGYFVMGSPPRDPSRNSDEYLHEVDLTHPYYMSPTEVTRAQWRAVVGVEETLPDILSLSTEDDPEDRTGVRWRLRPLLESERNLPATGVSYTDIFDIFLPALARRLEGNVRFPPRLPTEAEWEWAARAGTPANYPAGDDAAALAEVAWYEGNAEGHLHAVAGRPANPWGLHDMLGNAWELTLDSYDALFYLRSPRRNPVNLDVSTPAKISRGGSYINSPRLCRIPSRSTYMHEENRYPHAGFRLVLPTALLEGE